jgi:hypothetical protein
MKNTFTLDFSTIVFVAAVHAVGGIGIGMWLSERVPARSRGSIALALIALGAGMHVPMRQAVMRGRTDAIRP